MILIRVCLLWPHVAICGLVWPYLALLCLIWLHMVLLFFTAMVIQISVVLYGLLWSYMAFYGRIMSFPAVIDPNSFGLVKKLY